MIDTTTTVKKILEMYQVENYSNQRIYVILYYKIAAKSYFWVCKTPDIYHPQTLRETQVCKLETWPWSQGIVSICSQDKFQFVQITGVKSSIY